MTVRELRIGNFINTPRGIERIDYAESLEEIESYPEKFNGVPLTEEWLRKFGFEITENDYEDSFLFIYLDKNHQCRITKNPYGYYTYWPESLFDFCIDLGLEPKIHQLQNLYFALCGEELEIKL